jgi:electron transport complex protein RnfA
VIIAIVQLSELLLKSKVPALYDAFGKYLPFMITNCAILGVAFLNIDYAYGFWSSLVYSLGVSAGYVIVIMLMTAIKLRLNLSPVPSIIRGYPIIFFTAALMSLALMGFSGLFMAH